jgi:hypothetical protein
MTLYLVKAKLRKYLLGNLHKRLESGEILSMKPFGNALNYSLENAKIGNNDGYAYWIEEDYSSPPLAMERREIFDQYFDDNFVEKVPQSQIGWERIRRMPPLWKKIILIASLLLLCHRLDF